MSSKGSDMSTKGTHMCMCKCVYRGNHACHNHSLQDSHVENQVGDYDGSFEKQKINLILNLML